MNGIILAAIVAFFVSPSAIDGDEYSFSEGSGQFYALRHTPPDREPYEEVVGSSLALHRARTQAREGGYTLQIKGPFGGVREASAFIRREWNRNFGRPKKPMYGIAPATPAAVPAEETDPQ